VELRDRRTDRVRSLGTVIEVKYDGVLRFLTDLGYEILTDEVELRIIIEQMARNELGRKLLNSLARHIIEVLKK